MAQALLWAAPACVRTGVGSSSGFSSGWVAAAAPTRAAPAPGRDGGPGGTEASVGPEGGGSGSSSGGSPAGDAGGTRDDAASSDGHAGDAAACTADTQTDTKNCGACGHDCLGATCTMGFCTPESVGNFGNLTNVGGYFALDAANLYVSGDVVSGSKASHAIAAVPRSGGAAPAILSETSTEQWRGDRMLVAGGQVFWSNGDHAGILSVPTTAKNVAATVVFDDPSDGDPLVGLAAAGSTLYFIQACGALYEAPVPTGKYATIAQLSCSGVDMNQLALDPAGKTLYVTDNLDGEVISIATASGDQGIVVASANGPMAIATDGAHVYWTESGTCTGSDSSATCPDGEVRRATAPSGGSSTALVSKIASTGSLGGLGVVAVDATAVYYTVYDVTTTTLYERKLAGGAPVKLATDVAFLVLDGSYVYYTGGGEGVARIAK